MSNLSISEGEHAAEVRQARKFPYDDLEARITVCQSLRLALVCFV